MNLSICIRYSTSEDNILEIGFYRGEALLYNVFYNLEGLSEDDLIELKKEACAKFCSVFPEILLKDVMKGFNGVDDKMYQLYKDTFNPKGAGRKAGKKIGRIKPPTVSFHRNVTPEEKEFLEKALKEFRQQKRGL